MAATSPSHSSPATGPSLQQGIKPQAAARQAVAGKSDKGNAVTTDQQWLDEAQQVWAEQRAKEMELARAEKSGDRVMQLLEGEQLGDVTGQSLVLAQANTSEDDRKAAAAKAENDNKKAAALKNDDDDGGYIWPILGLGLLAAAAGGSGGGSTTTTPPPEPVEPGNELLVYTNEDEDDEGVRSESGDTDTNTDNGPYRLVRVAAYDNSDSAELDDGSGDSLYVNFADREDLLLEVSADGDDSFASADISTDESFSGEINVGAVGDDADSFLDFSAETSEEATHSIELTVDADGEGSSVDAGIDLYGEEGVSACVDAVVSAHGDDSYVTLDVYVSSDTDSGTSVLQGDMSLDAAGQGAAAFLEVDVDACDDALLSGDLSVSATGASADASGDVNVWSFSDDATIIGNLAVTTSAESADADLAVYVTVETEDDETDVAMVSADVRVTVEDGSENATADAYIEVSVESSGEAMYSGDVEVSTERGSYTSIASLEINLYGEDGHAHFSGDVLVSTDGVSTDANADISLDASDAEMEGHIEVVAGARDSCAEVDIGMCADDAWIWAGSVEVTDSDNADGVVGTTETDVAAEWSAVAKAQDNNAELYAGISADDYISAELNVTAQASWSSAEAEVVIDMSASNDIDLMGSEVNAYTLSIDSDDVSVSMGEDYTQTVEAAQFNSSASANASSDLSLDMTTYIDGSVEAHVNFLVDAEGRDADAETHVSISADGFVRMAGGWASSDTLTLSYSSTEVGNDTVAQGEDIAFGEDSQIQAAEWGVTASGVDADADFNLDIDGDNEYDVELYANLSVQASNEGGAYANIDLINGSLDTVYIGGETSVSFSWDVAYISDDAQDNLVGEDVNFTIASAEDAANWTATAADGAVASVDVSIEVDGSVDLHVNMAAFADADASADMDLVIETSSDVMIGGAIYGGADIEVTSSESDVYQDFSWGEDSSTTYEAASWEAVASGESGVADVYVSIDNTIGTLDTDYDVIISADLLTVASATDSTAEIDIEIDADDYVAFDGGRTYTYTSVDATPSDDVSQDYLTVVSTEYAADWQATASGVDAYSSIEVGVSGEVIDFRVDLTMTASGTDAMAGIDIELDASDEIYVSGEVTYSSGEDNNALSDYTSTDTQNAAWTASATGDGSLADFEFDANADGSIYLDVDVTATATGADSVSSVDISADSFSYDVNMGYSDDASITVTATGSNSLAFAEMNLFGEDVGYDGNITVTANAASGLDADAVMEINLSADDYSYLYGDISVSALGADNDASLVINVTSSYDTDSSDIGGNLYVKAVEGIASVSVSVDGSFDSFVSLDADEGGQVFMTIVADTVSTGDIYVYTDNDGVVTLNMDVNDFSSDEDIDVYGDEGGVFNLVLQDGFDVSVDLSDDVQGYAGQFNLVVETPLNFSVDAGDVYYSIEIEGFDATGLVIDTIDFKGAEFNGYYIDATVASDTYSDEYVSFDTFLTEAATALDGSVDYFFGTDGTDGWLAVDGDGDEIDYVIELLGVTNLDWDSVLSTQGQYTETVL